MESTLTTEWNHILIIVGTDLGSEFMLDLYKAFFFKNFKE